MLDLGYYYADGRYGDHFDTQEPYTTLYRVSRSGWYGDVIGPTRGAVMSLTRAVAAGKKLQIALDIGSTNVGGEPWRPYFHKVLQRLEDLNALSLVHSIEVRDEPSWSPVQSDKKAAAVRKVLAGRLEHVPLGVTLSTDDVLAGRARDFEGLYGWVGAEAYLPVRADWDPDDADEAAFDLIKKLRRKIPAGMRMLVVGQSYDRRSAAGQFGPARALKAVQHGTHEGARQVHADGIMWFSFGRPGGVESYSGLIREHRAIARAEGIL